MGWSLLQESARELLGEDCIPHLLAIEAWFGVYLAGPVNPTTLTIDDSTTPLQCASLTALVVELEKYGAARGLPTDWVGIKVMWQQYTDDDDPVDEDFDVQVYLQLLPLARLGLERTLPLWVVK